MEMEPTGGAAAAEGDESGGGAAVTSAAGSAVGRGEGSQLEDDTDTLAAWAALGDGTQDEVEGHGLRTRGKRSSAADGGESEGESEGEATGSERPQRKRLNMDPQAAQIQCVFTSARPGAPFERPLLLSPCSQQPDHLAGVSLSRHLSTWAEMAPPAALVAWEAKRLRAQALEADIIQLRATLRLAKDATKDQERLAGDAAESTRKSTDAVAAAAADYRALAAKCTSHREKRLAEAAASGAVPSAGEDGADEGADDDSGDAKGKGKKKSGRFGRAKK